jgi:hypothetical protein
MTAIPVAALARQPLVERRDCPAAAALAELCRQRGGELGTRHVADAEGHLLDLAAASLGPALLPERTVVPPPLVKRPFADAELSRTVAFAVVSGRRFSAALDAFVRLIRARDFTAIH